VYLYSGEQYYPADLQAHLSNTVPEINFTPVANVANPLTLNNLDTLSQDVYLTSKNDVTKYPAWIKGVKPDGSGKTNNAVSAAVIVNDKGNGNVDAFYMYFYSFDWGGIVAGIKALQFGELSRTRHFVNGKEQH
jgi:hypothetical protein